MGDEIEIDDVEDALKRADELAELTGRTKKDIIADLLDDGQLNYSAGDDAKVKKDILDLANEQAIKIKKLLTTLIPIMILVAGTGAEGLGIVDMTKWGEESVWDDENPPPYEEPDAPKVWGCTDPAASNYEDWANEDDDSCDYEEPTIWGCTDDMALNYNYDATDDDGGCEYDEPELIEGCTDDGATNYNSEAEQDDGSCEYEPEPCNDGDSDGVCDDDEIEGCTNSTATNYNSSATDDDGSCTYPPPEECDPVLYSAYSFYQNNNTTVTIAFDIDCTNAGVSENVSVQWLAWNNGSNHSNSEGPANWTTADYTIQGEEWDEYNLSLSNFTNGSYDLYLYIMWGDGMANDDYIERKWFNIIIKGEEND